MTTDCKIDFDRGELVRIRMTPEVVGQVIAEKDWGKSFLVRYGGSDEACWYENIELETYVPGEAKSDYGQEPPKNLPRKAAIDNVINMAERRDQRRASRGGVH